MNRDALAGIKSMSVRLPNGKHKCPTTLCQAGFHRPSIGSPSSKVMHLL
jgi:hypothetical protein